MKYSFTPKQNSVEEHGAFTPGGSMKTSPRISALIEKAAKSPLRANVGNGIVLDGIGMEDGEEGRRNVQQQQQQQQQDLLLSPWLMTFEDTPPEKKQNLIDLKTPPAPRDESVRLQPEFIKTQQNVTSASELKKQSSSKSKKKNNNNKRRTTRRRNTKQQQQHSNSSSNSMLNIWKLLPGSQTSSFNRPKTKANDFISIDTICYVRSST